MWQPCPFMKIQDGAAKYCHLPPPSQATQMKPAQSHQFITKLEVFREGIPPCNFNVSKLNCLLSMCALIYCLLHRLNVCGMQCTSYYIGYLHYNIKELEDQRVFILRFTLVPSLPHPLMAFNKYLLTNFRE